MKFTRTLIAGAAFLLAFQASAQFTDVINSNRPGESMSAFSVGKTVIQAETGGYYVSEKYDQSQSETQGWGIDLAVRYGAFFEQLELIAEFQYQNDHVDGVLTDEDRSGFRQMTFGGKYLVYDPNKNYEAKPNLYSWKANHKFKWRDLIPAVGVYGGFNLNHNNPFVVDQEPNFSPKLMVISQNQFKRSVLVINLIADKVATNYMTLGYVATLTYGINSRFSAFIENQGYQNDFYSDNIIRGGAAYLVRENIQVDLSAGTNFQNNPSQVIFGAGLSWRFDDNYEDVYLRLPKDDKESKADKDKKKKDKKKRKDGINPETGEPTE